MAADPGILDGPSRPLTLSIQRPTPFASVPLEAQGVEGHAQDEEERARIKHPDLPPQELALDPRVGDHLPKQRVDWGRHELILEGSRLRLREGDLREEV